MTLLTFCSFHQNHYHAVHGYTGNWIDIKTEICLIAEIQVNTAKMIYAKEKPKTAKEFLGIKLWNQIRKETGLQGGLGHMYYEAWRKLNPVSKEAQEILHKSKKNYSYFLKHLIKNYFFSSIR